MSECKNDGLKRVGGKSAVVCSLMGSVCITDSADLGDCMDLGDCTDLGECWQDAGVTLGARHAFQDYHYRGC